MSSSSTTVELGTIDLRDLCACPGPPCPDCCDVCCPLTPPGATLFTSMLNQSCAGLFVLTADDLSLTYDAIEDWWYGTGTYYIDGAAAGTYALTFTCAGETASLILEILSGSLPIAEYIGSQLFFDCDPFSGQWSFTVSLCRFDFTLTE